MTTPCPADDRITPDILAAAMQAVRDRYDASTSDERDNRMAFLRGDVLAVLEAAEPHIRRDERERIRRLAIDLALTTDHKASDSQHHALGDFADLIGETP